MDYDEYNNMENALNEFIKYANILSDNWENDFKTMDKYPKYLPSFDEFVQDMQQMVKE
jgi:hypothetical protein